MPPKVANQVCDLQVPACLSLPSVARALQQIAGRVPQGGHEAPRANVVRRFRRSLKNCRMLYQDLADKWTIDDS